MQFLVNALDVGANRSQADAQIRGDLLVGVALGQQLQHLQPQRLLQLHLQPKPLCLPMNSG